MGRQVRGGAGQRSSPSDAAKSMRLVNELRADSVFVNMPRMMASEFPWGGNVKESGMGKDGSMCGLEELTDLKLVCMAH